MIRVTIKKGQVWKSRLSGRQFRVISKSKKGRWKAIELSDSPRFSPSTHSFLPTILWKKFELL